MEKLKIVKMFLMTILTALLIINILKSCAQASAGTMIESNYKGTGSEIVEEIVNQYFDNGETDNQSFLSTLSSIYSALNNNYASVNIRFTKGTGTYWTNYLNVSVGNNQFIVNTNNYTNISITAPYTQYQLSNYRGSLTRVYNKSNKKLLYCFKYNE